MVIPVLFFRHEASAARASRLRRAARALRAAALAGCLAALAGCAAVHQPMGAPVQAPHIVGRTLVAPDGAHLPLRAWLPQGPARAVVLALHGMNDYSNAFEMPAQYWARHGVATYAYDQRGFGRAAQPGIWSDTATMAADLDAAVDAIAARHPQLPLYLLGESMGGAVVVAALASPPAAGRPPLAQRVRGAILSSPALWGRQTMNPFYRLTLWAAYHTMPGLEVRPPRGLKIEPSDNLDMLRALGRDPLVLKRTRIDAVSGLVDLMSRGYADLDRLPSELPVLVLYGQHEQVLDRAAVTQAIGRLEDAAAGAPTRLSVYPLGYHMLLRDRCAGIVWDDVLAWLDDAGAPLPSGGEGVAWRERAEAQAPVCTDAQAAAHGGPPRESAALEGTIRAGTVREGAAAGR